ncbi:carbohydrate kinase family protein [Saccharothrix xinjiangensis]|uniref:Carbohydrate kinase family protein n=1 Tax=Saccharothrix xinjiangensis TaxID=204798 RepID=A0ABV9Y092_9PSEU
MALLTVPASGRGAARAVPGIGGAESNVAIALARHAGRTRHAPTRPARVVDAVGAGDAFAGGYLSELVAGADVERCLRTGNALGGFVVGATGDWEGLPTRADLAAPEAEVVR